MSLGVDVTGESYLAAGAPGADDADPGPVPPGKVRAYRFMSYYLPPSEANAAELRGIVDPLWLRGSDQPEARALRELDVSAPAWRVLHRVTYVERTPPVGAGRSVATDAPVTPEPVNLAGNADLLRLVHQQLGSARPVTPGMAGDAVAAVMNPAPGPDGSYPEALLSRHVSWWDGFLAAARPGPHQDPEAADLLHRLTVETVAYCVNGYATGVLPLASGA